MSMCSSRDKCIIYKPNLSPPMNRKDKTIKKANYKRTQEAFSNKNFLRIRYE